MIRYKSAEYLRFILVLGSVLFFVVFTSFSCYREKDSPGNQPHTQPVLNVRQLGALGNGVADDTRFFQKAIDSVAALGGGTVLVPAGKYLVDPDVSIRLKSHVTLEMVDSLTELIAKPTASRRYGIILVINATEVNIKGGKITGDRYQHLDTLGEWGMGIAVYASNKININGTIIRDCWGDGLVVGAQTSFYSAPTASSLVTIKNVVSDNNRRQGLTIGRANQVLVDSCTFTNTRGTKPMSGIDIEPDRDSAQNITIQNCELAYNQGNGVEIYVNRSSMVKNVTIKNNFMHHNAYGGYLIRAQNVDFTENRIIQNKYSPLRTVELVNSVTSPNTLQ